MRGNEKWRNNASSNCAKRKCSDDKQKIKVGENGILFWNVKCREKMTNEVIDKISEAI